MSTRTTHATRLGQPLRLDEHVTTIILAGGSGERLMPLTRARCKPAVAFGGTLRMIDFTLMNCIASSLTRVYVLTRRNACALPKHCARRWGFLDDDAGGFVRTVPPDRAHSYAGTADAVHQNARLFAEAQTRTVLV